LTITRDDYGGRVTGHETDSSLPQGLGGQL